MRHALASVIRPKTSLMTTRLFMKRSVAAQARALRSRSVMTSSSARSIVSASVLVPSSFRARLILVSSRA